MCQSVNTFALFGEKVSILPQVLNFKIINVLQYAICLAGIAKINNLLSEYVQVAI